MKDGAIDYFGVCESLQRVRVPVPYLRVPKSSDLRLRLPKACGLLFCLAFFAGLVQVRIQGQVPFGDGYETVNVARSLARTGEFADPFAAGRTGPTAMTPPGYPFLLSLLLRAGGEAQSAKLATLFAVIAHAFGVAMLPLAARFFWGHSMPGTIAGFVSLIPPITWIIPAWDANVTAACLVGYCVLARFATPDSGAMLMRVALPAAGALAILMNPTALFVVLPVSCLATVRAGRTLPERMRQFAALWLLTALLVAPWAWRNYRALGSFTLKSNLGLTLNVSNSDCAKATLYESRVSGCYDRMVSNWNLAELEKLRQAGELSYDAEAQRQAIEWIKTHPSRFAALTLERVREFWFPTSYPLTPASWPLWMVTVLSAAGLGLMWRRGRAAALVFSGVFALYPVVFYIAVADMRYRFPIVWLSALAVGYLGFVCLETARLRTGWGGGLWRSLRSLSRSR